MNYSEYRAMIAGKDIKDDPRIKRIDYDADLEVIPNAPTT